MACLYFEEFPVDRTFAHPWSRTVTGMDNDSTLRTTVANLGMGDVRFPKPVFHGDALRARTRVVSVRDREPRTDVVLVEFEHTATNQRGEVVAVCRRTAMMKSKPVA